MEPLSVAILAGGMSRRMGRDKALLRIGGKTLLEIVAMRSRPLTDDLFVVASDRLEYAEMGFRVVPDVFPNAGSLGGIYTAVNAARREFCLVLACDMPLVNQRLLEAMAVVPRTYDALVPVIAGSHGGQRGDQTFETLHAIYRRSILQVAERRIRAGQLKVADMLSELGVKLLQENDLRGIDPRLYSFFNVNTREDFKFAQEMLSIGS